MTRDSFFDRFDGIETITELISERLGRSMEPCRDCGKPTRSHILTGRGHQCHSCYDGSITIIADGGVDDTPPLTLYEQAAEEWLQRNQPLSRDEIDSLSSSWVSGREPFADAPDDLVRATSPEDAGEFCAENDIGLVDLEPDKDCIAGMAAPVGVPTDNGGHVPVLLYTPIPNPITMDGEPKPAAHYIDTLTDYREQILDTDVDYILADGGDERDLCWHCDDLSPDDYTGAPPLCEVCRDPEKEHPPEEERPDPVGWEVVDFQTPDAGVWPDDLAGRQQWMGHQEKKPFAPWAEKNAPAPCTKDNHSAETTDKCECDARWKWGFRRNYATAEKVAMAEDDPRLDGRAFIQLENDPFAYVDGDDVRDPETGEVHPKFIDILQQLGLTYTDISQSGAGVHAQYRGDLPEGIKQASWQLDDETWGSNDELPSIEIYPGKRVCVATGDHVPGTPTDTREWDDQALESLLDENGQDQPEPTGPKGEQGYDLDDYTPDAIEKDETATDIRDAFKALDRIDARRVADKTIVHRWNDVASTSEEYRAFSPTWGRSSNGTANIVNDKIWQDTGDEGGYGGPIVMALIDAGEMSHRGASPRKARGELWFKGYERLRELGFDLPELDLDSDYEQARTPMSAVPIAMLEQMDHDEHRRFARRRGIDWKTVDEVRGLIHDAIHDSMEESEFTVIDSPTGSGKTHTVATTRWRNYPQVTGGDPVIHAHKTTKARDQAVAMSEDADVDYKVLRSRTETCPVAAGEYDPGNEHGNRQISIDGMPVKDWIDWLCDDMGNAYSVVHGWLEDATAQELPCRHGSECPSKSIFDGIPRDEDDHPSADVIHCTHQFLHVPGIRMHTNVVIDEKPDFEMDLNPDVVRRSINAYLQWSSAPVDSYSDLVIANRHGCEPKHAGEDQVGGILMHEYRKDFHERMADALREEPPLQWHREHLDVHALAPAFAQALWDADECADGRYSGSTHYNPPRFDDDAQDADSWNRTKVTLVFDQSFEPVTAWQKPDFSLTRSVIGTDATAHLGQTQWLLNADESIDVTTVLSGVERSRYRRFERGLFTVKVGDNMNPVTKEKYVEGNAGRKYKVLLEHLHDEYGDEFSTAITSKNAKNRLHEMMQEVGIDEPQLMHYGNEESRNDFAGEHVGYVNGVIDPGDNPIINRVAALKLDAQPERSDPDDNGKAAHCEACDGDGCQQCDGTGLKRAHGRGFEGPDAETAEAVLKEVSHHHVVQSAGRYARDADDPDDNAIVYIHTDRVPDSFIDTTTPGVIWTPNDGQQERLKYVRDQAYGATAREVAEATGCTKNTAYRTLKKAEEQGILKAHPGAGKHGATIYTESPESPSSGSADIEVDSGEITAKDVLGNHTWTVAVRSALAGAGPDYEGERADSGVMPSIGWFLTDPPGVDDPT